MATTFVETKCVVVSPAGQEFEAGGASCDGERLVAYPGKDGILTDWHGNRIGTWRSTASWRVHSYIGTHMHQIRARLDDGTVYTGRGFGEGMVFKGKRVKEAVR